MRAAWLVIASVALPRIRPDCDPMPDAAAADQEDRARRAGRDVAIRAIEQAQHEMAHGRGEADLYAEAASWAMDLYPPGLRLTARSGARRLLRSGDGRGPLSAHLFSSPDGKVFRQDLRCHQSCTDEQQGQPRPYLPRLPRDNAVRDGQAAQEDKRKAANLFHQIWHR
jgi:hypothetical protein